jgi:hypothetical protein
MTTVSWLTCPVVWYVQTVVLMKNVLLCDTGGHFCLPPDLAVREEYLTLNMGAVNPSKTLVNIFSLYGLGLTWNKHTSHIYQE